MPYLERLLTDSSSRYFIIALTTLLLAGILCGYVLLEDYRQQYRYAQLRNIHLQQEIAALSQTVSVLPVTVIPAPVSVLPAFSVIETLRKTGGRLVHWQPSESQATLELSIAWEQIPFFFHHLSNYQGVNLSSFKINGVTDPMAVALILEFSYESK